MNPAQGVGLKHKQPINGFEFLGYSIYMICYVLIFCWAILSDSFGKHYLT